MLMMFSQTLENLPATTNIALRTFYDLRRWANGLSPFLFRRAGVGPYLPELVHE